VYAVSRILINISQSVEGSIIGLPHTLICTVIVANGVSPSLVKVNWSGTTSLSESPRVVTFDQTYTGSQYKLRFGKALTFSPLLSHDIGEYTCSVKVTGFDRVGNSESAMVIANGMYQIPDLFFGSLPNPTKIEYFIQYIILISLLHLPGSLS